MTISEPRISIILNMQSGPMSDSLLESIVNLDYNNFRLAMAKKNHISPYFSNISKHLDVLQVEAPSDYTRLQVLNKIIYNEINAGSKFLFIINTDCVILPSSLIKMVKVFLERKSVGIVSGRNFLTNSSKRYNWKWDAQNNFLRNKVTLFKTKSFRCADISSDFFSNENAFLIRSEAIKKVGPYNTFLFRNSEHSELCLRVKQGGYNIIYDRHINVSLSIKDSGFYTREIHYWNSKNNYLFFWCFTDRNLRIFFNLLFSSLRNFDMFSFEKFTGNISGLLWIIRNGNKNKNYTENFNIFAKEKYLKEKFDYDFGIVTSSSREHDYLQLEDLNIISQNLDYGVESGPTPLLDFREIMEKIEHLTSGSTFIDLGSGLGRALLLATNFNFKKFIGIEFSEEINIISRKNIEIFKKKSNEKRDINVLTIDAAEFIFPIVPITIYMFNPFGPKVLSEVLANLELSVKKNPRPIFLVYFNSEHSETIDSSKTFKKILSRDKKRQKGWLDNSHPYVVYEAKF